MVQEKMTEQFAGSLAAIGLTDMNPADIYMMRFKKGEMICHEGLPILYLFILLDGKAQIFVTSKGGKMLLLGFCASKSMIGELELFTDGTATTNAQAVTEVLCIGIPLANYKNYLKANINFMNYLGSEMALKLTRSTKNNTANILYTLEARLCTYISIAAEENFFNKKLTEVSELLGTSYRHLLRTLGVLCDQGVLERSRQGYVIKDSSVLVRKSCGFESLILL